MLRRDLVAALNARRDNDVAVLVPLVAGGELRLTIDQVRYDPTLDAIEVVTEAYDPSLSDELAKPAGDGLFTEEDGAS